MRSTTRDAAGRLRSDRDVDPTGARPRRANHAHRTGKAIGQGVARRLYARGFKLDFGDDGTGWQFKYLTRGGGYYFNVGCSDLIVERRDRAGPVLRYRVASSPKARG